MNFLISWTIFDPITTRVASKLSHSVDSSNVCFSSLHAFYANATYCELATVASPIYRSAPTLMVVAELHMLPSETYFHVFLITPLRASSILKWRSITLI